MKVSAKAATAAAAVTLLALLFAAMPATASASDKDCKDFATQRAAQIFFLKHGGPRRDPDRLDGDNDGVACEDNPCPCYRKKHLPRLAISPADFAFMVAIAPLKAKSARARPRPGRFPG